MESVKAAGSIMAHGAKNEIIESTIDIVAKKGSWDVSVSDIASACRTTPASLYTYFSSKNEILESVRVEMEKRFAAVVNLPIPEKIPEEMKIRMMSFYIFDFIVKNRWAIDFVDPFSTYESTEKLMNRIEGLLNKTKLSKDEIKYRIFRFMAGVHFKIRYRFMLGQIPEEIDIDDLSRFMSYPESSGI